jgi:hypothetical protein
MAAAWASTLPSSAASVDWVAGASLSTLAVRAASPGLRRHCLAAQIVDFALQGGARRVALVQPGGHQGLLGFQLGEAVLETLLGAGHAGLFLLDHLQLPAQGVGLGVEGLLGGAAEKGKRGGDEDQGG